MPNSIPSLASALLVSLVFCASLSYAQSDNIPPCGSLTQSTRLTTDCFAPLTVGANNITVDLGGHTIHWPQGSLGGAAIDIINFTGATVQNGSVQAVGAPAILIRGGGSHTLSHLRTFITQGGTALVIAQSTGNEIGNTSFLLDAISFGISIGGERNKLVDSSLHALLDNFRPVITLEGKSNHLVGNQLRSKNGVIVISGSKAMLETNSVHTDLTEQPTPVSIITVTGEKLRMQSNAIIFADHSSGNNTIIRVASSGNQIENNSFINYNSLANGIHIDGGNNNIVRSNKSVGSIISRGSKNTIANNFFGAMFLGGGAVFIDGSTNKIIENHGYSFTDTTVGCGTNVWRNNYFTVDSEGDGQFAGCIQ